MHVALKHFFLATIIIVDRHLRNFFFSNDPYLVCSTGVGHTAVSDVLFQSHVHWLIDILVYTTVTVL